MGLNLKHAQYIMEIIKEGSITNASKTMHVSQPALSQTIKAVEKYLGAPIFLRNTKPIVLTEAGKKYIAAVKKIITISTNLLHEVSDIQYEGYGTLRLGIPIQRAMQMLPRVMPVFRQRYPHIKLEIKEAGSNITEKSVLNGDVDIAIMTTSPGNDELIYELVETEEGITSVRSRIPFLTYTTSNPIWSLKPAASKWGSGLSAPWMLSLSVRMSIWTIILWSRVTVSFIRSWALPISATAMSAREKTRT